MDDLENSYSAFGMWSEYQSEAHLPFRVSHTLTVHAVCTGLKRDLVCCCLSHQVCVVDLLLYTQDTGRHDSEKCNKVSGSLSSTRTHTHTHNY